MRMALQRGRALQACGTLGVQLCEAWLQLAQKWPPHNLPAASMAAPLLSPPTYVGRLCACCTACILALRCYLCPCVRLSLSDLASYRCRHIDTLMIAMQVRILSESGIREVTLLGQNVNSYADASVASPQKPLILEAGAGAAPFAVYAQVGSSILSLLCWKALHSIFFIWSWRSLPCPASAP